MKKNILLWCAALIVGQALVGCSALSRSCCKCDSACGFRLGLLQQTSTPVVLEDKRKMPPADETKEHGTLPKHTKIQNQDAKTGKLLPLFTLQKLTTSGPDRRFAKKVAPKEPLKLDVAPASGNVPASENNAVVSIPVLDLKGLPNPIVPTSANTVRQMETPAKVMPSEPGAITIRSDEVPMKVAAADPGNGKSNTITLKSVAFKYGATENYTILVGRVQEWRKTVRLRYAAVEQQDAHGGSVSLEGVADVHQLRDGQHVRVRGTLIPADGRAGSARFRVTSIEILD